MKYMLLIYADEQAWSEAEREKCYGDSAQLACQLREDGQDLALMYTDSGGTMLDASGRAVEVSNKAIEVLNRRPDGTWKLIVGDPNGRR